MKQIKRVLISVYDKTHLIKLVNQLKPFNIDFISTGGTKNALEKLGVQVTSVESVTEYPSILGGRVKTLHPKIFGGILNRSNNEHDQNDLNKLSIQKIDMVVVDLYPFQETVAQQGAHKEIIEKIDIGGVSLIRAAAKNYTDIFVVPSIHEFETATKIINSNKSWIFNNIFIFFYRF